MTSSCQDFLNGIDNLDNPFFLYCPCIYSNLLRQVQYFYIRIYLLETYSFSAQKKVWYRYFQRTHISITCKFSKKKHLEEHKIRYRLYEGPKGGKN